MPAQEQAERIPALDLIRGIAVLGILAVNIASFAMPDSATVSPNLPSSASQADQWAFAANLVLFEGKMRALFTLLFGASMLLFIERADQRGADGARLQLRRLGWLALFGYLHFALLWDGDILFLYALVGFGALAMRQAASLPAVLAGLLLFAGWQGVGLAMWYPSVSTEMAVVQGTATPAQVASHDRVLAQARSEDGKDLARAQLGYREEVSARLTEEPWFPLISLIFNWAEIFTFMLIGMALFRSGFFEGAWPRQRLIQLAVGVLGLGGTITIAFVCWAAGLGYPEMLMHLAIGSALGFAHLAMALGYAALLMLIASRFASGWLGQRLEAAGRMAFSNYIATSLVMGAIFSGWGLGWFGQFGTSARLPFVLLGWTLMLAWSKPWLAHFRHGPLEWLWRSLTVGRFAPMRQ